MLSGLSAYTSTWSTILWNALFGSPVLQEITNDKKRIADLLDQVTSCDVLYDSYRSRNDIRKQSPKAAVKMTQPAAENKEDIQATFKSFAAALTQEITASTQALQTAQEAFTKTFYEYNDNNKPVLSSEWDKIITVNKLHRLAHEQKAKIYELALNHLQLLQTWIAKTEDMLNSLNLTQAALKKLVQSVPEMKEQRPLFVGRLLLTVLNVDASVADVINQAFLQASKVVTIGSAIEAPLDVKHTAERAEHNTASVIVNMDKLSASLLPSRGIFTCDPADPYASEVKPSTTVHYQPEECDSLQLIDGAPTVPIHSNLSRTPSGNFI